LTSIFDLVASGALHPRYGASMIDVYLSLTQTLCLLSCNYYTGLKVRSLAQSWTLRRSRSESASEIEALTTVLCPPKILFSLAPSLGNCDYFSPPAIWAWKCVDFSNSDSPAPTSYGETETTIQTFRLSFPNFYNGKHREFGHDFPPQFSLRQSGERKQRVWSLKDAMKRLRLTCLFSRSQPTLRYKNKIDLSAQNRAVTIGRIVNNSTAHCWMATL